MLLVHKFLLRSPFLQLDIRTSHDPWAILESQAFIESVYISSPSLILEVEKYKNGLLGGIEKEKLELSLYRYYLRSSYRCTPFGLFAGISPGELANKTAIKVAPRSLGKKKLDLIIIS
jgi:lantibiotic biosynthesis protein